MNKVDSKVDKLDSRVDKLDSKVDSLEQKMDKKFDAAFNIFATKDDIKEAVVESEERMTKKIDKILTAVDGIVKSHEDHQIEHVANVGAHDRFDEKFVETDKRIGKIKKIS